MGYLLKNYWRLLKNSKRGKLRENIRVVVMDVDGTLTDGSINIGQNGELFKRFYCRDGLAIIAAEKKGIIPIVLTSRVSEIVKRRAEELKIDHVYQGFVDDKRVQLERILDELHLEWQNVAYIGDDRNDLECMKKCGIVGCPSDAERNVKRQADYICMCKGGQGAVREFIDWLLEGKKGS